MASHCELVKLIAPDLACHDYKPTCWSNHMMSNSADSGIEIATCADSVSLLSIQMPKRGAANVMTNGTSELPRISLSKLLRSQPPRCRMC